MFVLTKDMSTGKPGKVLLGFALPMLLGNLFQQFYNMVDTWFISLTGDTNLVAGVSLCSPVFVLSIAMGDIWGLGPYPG